MKKLNTLELVVAFLIVGRSHSLLPVRKKGLNHEIRAVDTYTTFVFSTFHIDSLQLCALLFLIVVGFFLIY